jgi:hypothetical protein
MDKIEHLLLQKLKKRKKLCKLEVNHRQQKSYKRMTKKKRNLIQKVNLRLKNKKYSHKWNTEEKCKKIKMKLNKKFKNHKNLKQKKKNKYRRNKAKNTK